MRFRVDYKSQAGREYATVFLPGDQNVVHQALQQGFVKLRQPQKSDAGLDPELVAMEQAAQAAGLGIWAKDSATIEAVCLISRILRFDLQ